MKDNNERIDNKERDKAIYSKLGKVALPLAGQSLITSSLSFIDTLFIGGLGDTELAAVGLSSQIFFVFWMVLFGFNGGTVTYMAQFWGKRDLSNLRKVVGIDLVVCLSIGVVFFVVCLLFSGSVIRLFSEDPEVIALGTPYIKLGSIVFLTLSIVVPLTAMLKSTQQTKIPFIISLVVFAVNTGLGLCLIYGFLGFPRLEVMGACIGIVISRCLELILYLIVIFAKKNIVAAPLKAFFSWNRELFTRVVKNSVMTMLNEALWGIGTAMYSAAYGRISVPAAAAVQAGSMVMNLFSLACFSMGEAMLILVGEKLGVGLLAEAKYMAAKIMKMVAIVGLIAGGLLLLSSRFIVLLFYNLSTEAIGDTLLILAVFSGVMVIKVVNGALVTGVLRAGGDTRFAMLSETLCVWLIGVPSAFFFALFMHLPIYLVVLIVQAEEIVKFFILTKRYRSDKWVKDLVDDIGTES